MIHAVTALRVQNRIGAPETRSAHTVFFSERRATAEGRAFPRHRTGDFVSGSTNSQIATVVERRGHYFTRVHVGSNGSRRQYPPKGIVLPSYSLRPMTIDDPTRSDDGYDDLTRAVRLNLGYDRYQLDDCLAAGKQLAMAFEGGQTHPTRRPNWSRDSQHGDRRAEMKPEEAIAWPSPLRESVPADALPQVFRAICGTAGCDQFANATSFARAASIDHSTSASTPGAVAAASPGCKHAQPPHPTDAPAQARLRRVSPSHAHGLLC